MMKRFRRSSISSSLLAVASSTWLVLAASPAPEAAPATTYYCFGVVANIHGTTGDDILFGADNAVDSMVGLGGDDFIDAGTGNWYDYLCGNDGADDEYGHDGADSFHGDNGNDSEDGGPGNDLMYGGPDNDIMSDGSGSDTLYGGTGSDTFFKCDNNNTYSSMETVIQGC